MRRENLARKIDEGEKKILKCAIYNSEQTKQGASEVGGNQAAGMEVDQERVMAVGSADRE